MTVNTWIAGSNGGLLRVQSDGSYEWNPNGEFNALALGASTTTEFKITMADDDQMEVTAALTVTVANYEIEINVASGNQVEMSVPATMNDAVPVTVTSTGLYPGTYNFTAAQIRQAAPLYFPGTASITLVEE